MLDIEKFNFDLSKAQIAVQGSTAGNIRVHTTFHGIAILPYTTQKVELEYAQIIS